MTTGKKVETRVCFKATAFGNYTIGELNRIKGFNRGIDRLCRQQDKIINKGVEKKMKTKKPRYITLDIIRVGTLLTIFSLVSINVLDELGKVNYDFGFDYKFIFLLLIMLSIYFLGYNDRMKQEKKT